MTPTRILRNMIVLLLAALMLSGCWWDDYQWRQKLGIEIGQCDSDLPVEIF